jgi:hypothetical protein
MSQEPVLIFHELTCIDTEDWSGADEAYLTLNGKTIWGVQAMNNGNVLDVSNALNRSVPDPSTYKGELKLQLWDQDTGKFGDNDDLLGTVDLHKMNDQDQNALHIGNGQHFSFTGDGASYTLTYDYSFV